MHIERAGPYENLILPFLLPVYISQFIISSSLLLVKFHRFFIINMLVFRSKMNSQIFTSWIGLSIVGTIKLSNFVSMKWRKMNKIFFQINSCPVTLFPLDWFELLELSTRRFPFVPKKEILQTFFVSNGSCCNFFYKVPDVRFLPILSF